jgi:hypothetical protein
MNFQDAVKKSIKAFTEGNMPKNLMEMKAEEGLMFTPEYFDELEASLVEEKGSSKKSKKKEEPLDDA